MAVKLPSWESSKEAAAISLPPVVSPSRNAVRSASRLPPEAEEIEAEMKLLGWHKIANEAALKTALIKTKQTKFGEKARGARSYLAIENKDEWVQQVIDDEQNRPLQVGNDFIQKFEEKEQAHEERLDQEIQTHISSLKKLKNDIAARENLRQKNVRYRQQLATLKKVPTSVSKKQQQHEPSRGDNNNKGEHSPSKNGGSPGRQGEGMPNIGKSLEKLVDLEKRIADLETSQSADTEIKFIKKKTDTTLAAPSRVVYSVSVSKKNSRGKLPSLPRIQDGRSQVSLSKSPTKRGGDGGTFLTALPEVQHRSRNLSELDKRKQSRNQKQKEKVEKSAHQDKVINKWLDQKKQAPVKRKLPARPGPVQRVAKGAASGKRSGNKHMQEFEDMKRQVQLRKEAVAKKQVTVAGPRRVTASKITSATVSRSTIGNKKSNTAAPSASSTGTNRVTVAKIKVTTLKKGPGSRTVGAGSRLLPATGALIGVPKGGSRLGGSAAAASSTTKTKQVTFTRRTLRVKAAAPAKR